MIESRHLNSEAVGLGWKRCQGLLPAALYYTGAAPTLLARASRSRLPTFSSETQLHMSALCAIFFANASGKYFDFTIKPSSFR